MLKKHYPGLFADDPAWQKRAGAFSARVHELVGFLVDVQGRHARSRPSSGTVTYHDSLLGAARARRQAQPRALLKTSRG